MPLSHGKTQFHVLGTEFWNPWDWCKSTLKFVDNFMLAVADEVQQKYVYEHCQI